MYMQMQGSDSFSDDDDDIGTKNNKKDYRKRITARRRSSRGVESGTSSNTYRMQDVPALERGTVDKAKVIIYIA